MSLPIQVMYVSTQVQASCCSVCCHRQMSEVIVSIVRQFSKLGAAVRAPIGCAHPSHGAVLAPLVNRNKHITVSGCSVTHVKS